jgi:uncharacterized protein (TIGR01777 family)
VDMRGRQAEQASVLLSGASGMLGTALAKALRQSGASVLRLVRCEPRSAEELRWDPTSNAQGAEGVPFEIGRLEGIGAAVHLSGANVASRRWTAGYKREMTESRVQTTRVLAETLAQLKTPPQVLVAASAVGFYGDRGDEVLDEDSAAGSGYFPELCAAWEAATGPAEDAGIRVVHLRFGMVIGRDGGAMARLKPMFRLGLGGKLGDGRQWMSWVSEMDAVRAALFALQTDSLSGPMNVVAPQPVMNVEFTRELGQAVHRPAVIAAPAFALRLAFGEMADEALLASTRAVPKRLLEAGFGFVHPTLAEAFAAALAA